MSKPSKFKKLTLIILFTALYSTSAFVSGFHAIEFFSLANPFWLALLLAITFEVGQATVLFYLLQGHQNQSSKNKINNFGKYGPWILMTVLTLTQCIGNIYSSHRYMVTRSTDNIKYFTDSVLFFIKDPDPQVNIVFIDYIVGFLLPIVALAMTSMVVEVLKDHSIETEEVDIFLNNDSSSEEPNYNENNTVKKEGELNEPNNEVKEEVTKKPYLYMVE
jgi:hypothetical protein